MLYLDMSWFYIEVSFPHLQMSWIKSVFTTLLFTSGFVFSGFPDSSVGKNPPTTQEIPSLIPRLGRSAEEGIGYPLQ